ncbi:MAG: GNAT family N-acetyltransferase [Paracoccaceae bacterium]
MKMPMDTAVAERDTDCPETAGTDTAADLRGLLERLGAQTLALDVGAAATPEEIAAHFRRLSPQSRRLRFSHQISDGAIDTAAEAASRARLVTMREGGVLRGLAELYQIDAERAEFAVSLEDDHQGRGFGRWLFEAAMALAAGDGRRRILVICLAENGAMRHLADRPGTVSEVDDGELTAWVTVA